MPEWKPEILRRLAPLRLAPTREADIADELAQHLEDRYQELLATGQSEDAAFRTAIDELKGEDLLARGLRSVERDWYRESIAVGQDSNNVFSGIFQDVRYALRMLRKSPGFTAVAVLTVALGIGANTTIFSWVRSTVLNPIPGVNHTSEYIAISTGGTDDANPISYPDYVDLRDRNHTLSSLIAASPRAMSLTARAKPERVWGLLVSANYFDGLGLLPVLGRVFFPPEGKKPRGAPVVVISYHLWQRHFGGDPAVIGQTVEIDRHPLAVVGVAPRAFVGAQTGQTYDLWIPVMMAGDFFNSKDAGALLHDRGTQWLICTGHLRPGVTADQAQADLNVLMQQNVKQFPKDHMGDYSVTASPLWRAPFGANYYLHTILFLLLAISGVILLLACANVANLLLVRSVVRRREMAIRLSIGATRWRLVRQLLAESLILGICGGVIAMLFTLRTAGALSDFIPHVAEVPISITATADRTVLFVTFIISIITSVIFGILPALRSSSLQPVNVLKEEVGSASGGLHKARLSSILVVAQIAMSLLLLVCAGLFIRSVRSKEQFNPGFNAHHVLLDYYDLSGLGYDSKSGTQFNRQLFDKLQTMPGAESATIANWIPLGFASNVASIEAEDYVPRPHESMSIEYADVGPNFLRTLQIPLVSGREFTVADINGSQLVAVVNAAFAQRYWPHQDAVGKKLKANETWFVVVGVAQNSDNDDIGQKPTPFLYLPLFQDYAQRIAIYVRTPGNPLAFAGPVQDAVHSLDADLPLFDLTTLDSRVQLIATPQRMGGVFVGGFGNLALVLAGIGIYGVLAYTTRQRTHEIGIRMALGAEPRDVLRLVLRQGLTLVLVGLAIGLAASFVLTRALSSELFGISATDPLTFTAVAILLLAVALLACYMPARRAMRVDPMVALRYE
jgi:predicted permease